MTVADQPGLGSVLHIARRTGVRLVGAVLVILGVATVVFLISAATKQNAELAVLGVGASPQAMADFERQHGLDQPVVVQYLRYLGNVLRGNLGTSLVTDQSISSLIVRAIPVTASLAFLATTLSAVVSLTFGCIAARFHGRWPDRCVRFFGSVSQSLPSFWVGVLAIQFVAIKLKFLPAGGYVPLTQSVSGWFHSMILPVVVLSIPFSAGMTRVVRASMVEQLDRDYVRTARGLGLTMRAIMVHNVMRNGLVAPVTILALSLGGLLGGAVLVETVFRLPGLGLLLANAISQRDFGVVEAVSMVSGVAFVIVNLLIDVIHAWLSPRKVNEV